MKVDANALLRFGQHFLLGLGTKKSEGGTYSRVAVFRQINYPSSCG